MRHFGILLQLKNISPIIIKLPIITKAETAIRFTEKQYSLSGCFVS